MSLVADFDRAVLTAAVVRTPAGAKKYGQPIGSTITRDRVLDVQRALHAVTVPAPHKGHVPTLEEVADVVSKADSLGYKERDARGAFRAALYLDAAGYNEPPTVLPTKAFDAIQGKTLSHYDNGVEKLSEFWRGTMESRIGDPYTNLTTAEPTNFYVGYGIYSHGTHVGNAHSAAAFAEIAGHRVPKTSTRFSDGSSMVRIKIHPDARVGHFRSMRATSVEIVKWAVEHKYDILELTSTQENKAGIAILNRSVMIVEEIEDENTGRVASAGVALERGLDVSAGGAGDAGLGATAAGLPAEGRGHVPQALGTQHSAQPVGVTAAGGSWRWQLRDSKGQWVEMGSEVKWLSQGVLHQGRVTGSPSPGVATVRDADGNDRNVPSSRLTALTPAPSAPSAPAAVPNTGRRLTRQVREKTQKASLTFKQTPTMEAAMQDMADIIQTDVDPKDQEAAIEATSDVIVGEIAGNLPKRLQLLERVKELRRRGAEAHIRLAVYVHTQPKLKKLTEKAKIWAEEFLGDAYASENPTPGWAAIPTMIGLPNPASHPVEFLTESSRMITQLLKAASALVGSGRSVIAAGDSWRWQLRDKDGKWIEMGSEVKWLARGRWKFGIVVGSPAPGVATVEEALTAIRHDLPSARLEVVEQGAALIELVDAIRDEKGRVDWKSLNLSRDAATTVIQKVADQKIELQDRRERYARQMGARVKEWLASDTPPWSDPEGIRAGKYPGITVVDQTWTAKGQSPGAGQYDPETGDFVITELGLSGDKRNDDWRKSLILHEAGHALQMRIFDDIGWRDTYKNALFDAIRRPEPVTYKDRNGANNRSRLESPFEEEGHAPGHHDEDKEVVADAISVILSGTSYQHADNPKTVALLNAVAEQMDQHGWEHPPLYETPPLPEWSNWRKGTTFDGKPEWVQRPGGDEISIRKAKAGYFIVATDHHGAGPMSRTGTAKTLAEAKKKGVELLAGLQADREPEKVTKQPDKIAAGDLKPGSVYTTRLDRDRVRVLDIIPGDDPDYVSFNGVILDGPNAGGGTIMSMKRTLQLNDEGHSDGQDFDRDVLAPAKVLLEGLKTKYPDGLAAALQEALTPEEEPRPEMSDRLKELGRTTEIVRWQADLGLAQARLRELEDERATAPPGRSMALQIKMDAARDEVESLTAWRVGGVIEEYDRLLKEHQEAGREWIQRSIVGGGSITPHSPKAQRILADVREVGRMIRVGVDIEVLERGTPAPNPERTKLVKELNRLRDQRTPLYEERSRGIKVLLDMTDDDKAAAILALDQRINADLQPINRAILDVQVLLNKIPDDDSVDPAFHGLTYSVDQKRLFTKWARRRELARRAVAELVGTTTETKQTWAPPKVPVPDDGTIYGRNLGDLTPEQQAAMTTMLLAYPASWVERFDQQIVTTSMGTRGWNNGPHIVISNKDGQGLSNGHNSMWATIIHEQGHGMESQVPGLAGLEAVWWHDRLGVKSKKDLYSDDGAFFPHRSSLEHPDNLARPTSQDYTLKAYGNVYSSAIPHWEVFTTGVQEVLGDGKDSYTTQHGPDGYDADLWEFTMGTLLTLDGRKA